MTGYSPGWAREVSARMTAAAQLVLVGNVDDVHLTASAPDAPNLVFRSTSDVLRDCLIQAGYTVVLRWNILAGATALYEPETKASDIAGARTWERRAEPSADVLADLMQAVVRRQGVRAAIIIEGAPRLAADAQDPRLHALYAIARQLSIETPRTSEASDRRKGLRNLVIWTASRESELPHWLLAAQGVRVVSVPEPMMETRMMAATRLVPSLPGADRLTEEGRQDAEKTLANHTEGMSLTDLRAAALTAVDRRIDVADIADAVRYLRSGVQGSPWQETAVRKRIAESAEVLNKTVFGQENAVRKAVDALGRAALGLSGAHSEGHPNRPRGVLFFAGPTGVGKTELAKRMAETVFGRAEAIARFDMSEYSSEHSEARLLGAPPGFIGHDSGGELTNAVRRRPFSLLLFDEIDKAHPRILDKFLQILEDGRLTDGAGSTVYFTDAFIVFTSNLGVYRQEEENGPVVPIVQPGAPYKEVNDRVRAAVHQHFTDIKRPELLNRIGMDNIVVFNFISFESAQSILRRSLGNVRETVRRNTGVELTVGPRAVSRLEELIMRPENLAFGGRAVAEVVASHLVNPLSRELLTRDGGGSLEVADILVDDDVPRIILREPAELGM